MSFKHAHQPQLLDDEPGSINKQQNINKLLKSVTYTSTAHSVNLKRNNQTDCVKRGIAHKC